MRKFVVFLVFVVLVAFAGIFFFRKMVGQVEPQGMKNLSGEAKELMDSAFVGVPDFRDYHCHLVAAGSHCQACYVNHKMTHGFHVGERLKFLAYLKASGVNDQELTDQQFLERLGVLVNDFSKAQHAVDASASSRFSLLAFDQRYDFTGNADTNQTPFYVSNHYLDSVAKTNEEQYIRCVSIHPYRKDAAQELEKWAKGGARQVKWLPNAMGIDPSDPRCDPFYDIMKKYDMVLLSHAGHEKAVHAEEDQKFGNPLLLRRPLDKGVKVIIAHCASLGQNPDLDAEGEPLVDNLSLFLRLMDEPNYDQLVFGDISAVTQYNRLEALEVLLRRTDLHSRLVNGSDYPLPAINVVIQTGKLVEAGFLTEQQAELLEELYEANPLIFDFVLKRCLRHPENAEWRFKANVFQTNKTLGF